MGLTWFIIACSKPPLRCSALQASAPCHGPIQVGSCQLWFSLKSSKFQDSNPNPFPIPVECSGCRLATNCSYQQLPGTALGVAFSESHYSHCNPHPQAVMQAPQVQTRMPGAFGAMGGWIWMIRMEEVHGGSWRFYMFQSPSPDPRFQSVPMAGKGAGKAPLGKGRGLRLSALRELVELQIFYRNLT